MKIVTIIPLEKGPLRGDLTYFTSKNIENGSIVEATLRSKKILGLVVSVEELTGSKGEVKEMDFNLKKIIDVKEHSVFRKEFLDSVLLTAKYFAARNNDTIATLIPGILREEYDKISKFTKMESVKPAAQKGIRNEKLILQASLDERISSYKTLIRGSFAQKKSVFMVLPTEYDIENFNKILGKGIEKFTFFVHSGLARNKLVERVERILASDHPVLIIGTAPFLAIPRHNIGTVVLEHENSTAYKTIARPHLDLRIFAEIFAEKINAKFILGDTLLRFETIGRGEIENISPVHPLSFRTDFGGKIEIVPKGDKFKILTDETVENIKNAVAKKKKVFVFSFRKGLATMTICRDCSTIVFCDRCSAPVVLYESQDGKKRMFICNRCKRELPAETTCATCAGWNLMPLGIGTETVQEELKNVFHGEKSVKIFKLDKESAKTKKGARDIIKEFEATSGSILVGTEMAFFYMKEKVALSIIASFDSLWSIPSFKMSEKVVEIMLAAVAKTNDTFIVETRNENDAAIRAVESGNLAPFVREELYDRKKLDYPPYKRFIKITHLADKIQTAGAKEMLQELFKDYNPEIFSGFVAKMQGKYITNTLIKLDLKKWSLPELSLNSSIDENLLTRIRSLPPNFEVFVDPEDLL